MPEIQGNVEFYMGPNDVGAPDDLETVIVDFIDKAQKRLEIAVQELESEPIARAIIRARLRKILVKLVIEHDYLKASKAQADPWLAGGTNEKNRQIHNALLRTRIDIKPDYNTSIFHQKFIIRDRALEEPGASKFTFQQTSEHTLQAINIGRENFYQV